MLTILAELLTEHIFTSSYLFDPEPEFQHAWIELARANPSKERLLRGMLLSIDGKAEDDIIAGRREAVVDELMDYVVGILPWSKAEILRKDLSGLTKNAVEIWRSLQLRKVKIEASTEGADGWTWPSHRFSSANGHTPESLPMQEVGTDEPAVCVFPRVFVAGAQQNDAVFSGMSIMKSEVDAADRQIRSARAPSPPTSRRGSLANHRRQSSSTTTAANGSPRNFLGLLPLGH